MNRIARLALLLTLFAGLIAGCGRRLPEEGVTSAATTAPTAVAEAPEVAETEPVAAEVEAEVAETEAAEPAEAEATEEADAEVDDAAAEPAEDDPVAVAIAEGDIALGQQVFNQQYDTSVGPWICASCHSVDEARVRLVGPGLWGMAETSETRITESGDADAVEYVYNSIVNPMAYIVPADQGGAYPENLMPPNYAEVLSEEELDAVVAYVLSLQ